jgi:raffinose/stachyose/melibiose transport system permease protein
MRFTVSLKAQSQVIHSPISQRRQRQIGKFVTITLFLLPSAVLFFTFVILPIIQEAQYSLYDWSGLGDLDTFIGLKNFQTLLADPVFIQSVVHNIIIIVLSLAIQIPLSITLALMVNRKMPGRAVFRMIFFLPYIVADAIAGLVFYFIYNPGYGPIAGIAKQINPSAPPPALLADQHLVLYAIFVVAIWKYFGYHFILYVAGLQNISDEVIEAARVDGATAFQTLRDVTLPLLGGTIRLSVFLSILGSLQFFDLVYVLSDGGPAFASETMAHYLYVFGIQSQRMGFASAAGIILFIICFIFALLYQRFVMSQDLSGSSSML